MKRILIITGGGKKHLEPFLQYEKEFGVKVKIASFSQISYQTSGSRVIVKVDGTPLEKFNVVYIRLSGKRIEDTALLTDYITSHNIPIIDSCYSKSKVFPVTQSKALELKLLYDKNIPIPKTLFANLNKIKEQGSKKLGMPFVIKRTDGKKSNAVWSPKTTEQLDELLQDLKSQEKLGKRFFAQEFIKSSQRLRVLVIGKKPIACITRGTRWRRRFVEKVNGEIPEKVTRVITPIPRDIAKLAVLATKAIGLEISGVDILIDDKTHKKFVLEVNSAPRWYSISRDAGISVEREIVKYLASLC